MILGIVGAEAAKFTAIGERRAKQAIANLIERHKPLAVSSGACEMGGVDIWTEEEAKRQGCFDPAYIFPPLERNWERGFQPRNIKIAQASHVVVSITVDRFPPNFRGRRFPICYHCHRNGDKTPHIKSGGCWTMWHAKSIGKQMERIIIANDWD